MSLEVDPLAPVNPLSVEPAVIVSPLVPESPSTLDPFATAPTSITAEIDLANQLASEPLSQLQTQANAGDQAAMDELEWRAEHEHFQPPEFAEPSQAIGLHGSASSEELDKGMQIDETV